MNEEEEEQLRKLILETTKFSFSLNPNLAKEDINAISNRIAKMFNFITTCRDTLPCKTTAHVDKTFCPSCEAEKLFPFVKLSKKEIK